MRTIELKVYKYKELDEIAQRKVENNIINDIINTTDFEKLDKHTKLYKAYKKSIDLRTPWFLAQYIWEECKDLILKYANVNEYFEDGEIYIENVE